MYTCTVSIQGLDCLKTREFDIAEILQAAFSKTFSWEKNAVF